MAAIGTSRFFMALTVYQTTNFWSKLREFEFADNKLDLIEKLKFVLGRVENVVGKGENAGFQHFLLFPQCFKYDSFTRSLKIRIV